jgi:hypothetical protein
LISAQELPFRYRNERGEWTEWTGLIYKPHGDGPFPLAYVAGYECAEEMAKGFALQGVVVVTPRMLLDEAHWPNPNPIGRGLKLDEALLRAARTLPYVDDTKVIITGGSAGGYMTMLLTAATFPLAGAFPMVPPVNLNYGLATWRYNEKGIRALREDGVSNAMIHPGSDGISGLWEAVAGWHGEGGAELFQWSPLAHLDAMTCPMVVQATSADALVPMPQFGGPLVEVAVADAPDIYPIDHGTVCTDELQRRTLLGMLAEDQVQVHLLDVPEGAPVLDDAFNPPPGGKTIEVPTDWTKQWMVLLLDEGSPNPEVGHFKYTVGINIVPLVLQSLQQSIAVDQLTVPKLEVLADRWLGRDWIDPAKGDRDLTAEEFEDERADVRRGLSTYLRVSDDHGKRLAELVEELSPERRGAIHTATPRP